jgi:hypothetical protein
MIQRSSAQYASAARIGNRRNLVRLGSRLCENAKAINRDRTSYTFKTVSYAHIASAFNFEIEIKNIILVALRIFEFSHGLGPACVKTPSML